MKTRQEKLEDLAFFVKTYQSQVKKIAGVSAPVVEAGLGAGAKAIGESVLGKVLAPVMIAQLSGMVVEAVTSHFYDITLNLNDLDEALDNLDKTVEDKPKDIPVNWDQKFEELKARERALQQEREEINKLKPELESNVGCSRCF